MTLLEVQDPNASTAAVRRPLDLYATPPDVAAAICKRLVDLGVRPQAIIEPSAGPGRFVAASRVAWPGARVLAVDIDGAHRAACMEAGASRFVESDWKRYAGAFERWDDDPEILILGNPPYGEAQAHVAAALAILRPGERLVFLLRHSFHASEERVPFFEEFPEEWASIVLPRPSYVGEGGDMADACVFCWQKGYRGPSLRADPILWGSALAKRSMAKAQLDLVGRPA